MERRTFLNKACLGCVGILGLGVVAASLQSCAPIPFILLESKSEDEVKVSESEFVEDQNLVILKNKEWEADVLLVKIIDKKTKNITYNALKMECTHNPTPLTATKHGLNCSTHGSSFDLEGQVTLQPATQPLKKYQVTIENKIIKINITTKK